MKRSKLHLLASSLLLSGLALAKAPELREHPLRSVSQSAERQVHLVTVQPGQTKTAVLEQIRQIDPTAKTVYQSRLRPDLVWLELAGTTPARLPAGIHVAPDLPVRLSDNRAGLAPASKTATTAQRVNSPPALSSDNNAGAGVRVAIISTGVDYTHQALGGPGTRASYEKAILNERAQWSGFPTTVVVDGFDFCSTLGCGSEQSYFDPNPIEPEEIDAAQLTGRGTHLASVVHALAPGAQLVAYKISNTVMTPGNGLVREYANFQTLARMFDRLVDPNLDGDRSDRVPIALFDMLGAFAYNPQDNTSPSREQVLTNLIEAASAHGVLVVTTAGDWLLGSKYSISPAGAAPSALTVAGIEQDGALQLRAAPYSAHGPVRGNATYNKPDIASYSNAINGALVGGGGQLVERSHVGLAAARIAAAAAILKGARPQLSSSELKAALVNTAVNDVRSLVDDQLADLTEVGNGREQIGAAMATPVLAWVSHDKQPSLNFGLQEVQAEVRLMREVTLRNLGDRDVSYNVSHRWLAEKAGNAAVTVEYPALVTVPARRSITVPVVLRIDGSKLPAWSQTDSSHASIAAFRAVDLNGQLVLAPSQGDPLHIGLRVMPRAKTKIERRYSTISEDYGTPFAQQHSPNGTGLSMDIGNNGHTPVQLAAYPLLAKIDALPPSYKGRKGDLFRYLAGGISVDDRCDSGHKLSLAVSYWEPTEIALAAQFDKMGEPVFYWEIYPKRIVEAHELHIKMRYQPVLADSDYVGYGWVDIGPDGKPRGRYIDLNMTYDPYEPTKRIKTSKLPVLFAGNTRNIVQQLCLEELYHHTLDTVADFDENLGFLFASNRDAHPQLNQPIIFHNPVGNGYGEVNDFGEQKKIGANVTFTDEGGETLPGPANSVITLAPGESARLHAVKDGSCDSFLGSKPEICWRDNNRFLLMSLTGDWVFESPVSYGDSSVVPTVAAEQSFVISENAEAGTFVGKVELDSQSFFALAGDYQLMLMGDVPGIPFALSATGELRVANPSALDFEHAPEITLQVAGRNAPGTIWSPSVALTVQLQNANDNPPLQIADIDLPDAKQGQRYEFDLASYFADADGDELIFSAERIPDGMSLDSHGKLSGTPRSTASQTLLLTLWDGENETSVSLELNITDNGGGGAAVHGLLMALCLLLGIRAKQRQTMQRVNGQE